MMNSQDLLAYLHKHIPISAAMGISVGTSSDQLVELRAALAPNLNHRSTAFGGSVGSLAVLAGWSLLRIGLDDIKPTPQIVIQRTTIEYLTPIRSDFTATCRRPTEETWQRFMQALTRRGRGRLRLSVEVTCDGAAAGHLNGEFVALTDE